ncbi:MAG: M20/M25/M40 family metallo-hydrolase, partial [Candidatus Latescibacterota bacterium]
RRADGWSGDPFTGRVRRGRLYGRGACDMKGPLAACLCAAARLGGRELVAPLYIVVTADEEIQARGAREVVARSPLFEAAASGYGVICEPTRLRVVHAHKGALTMTATARGRAAHTSTLRGVNANLKMIPFLWDMRKIYQRVLTAQAYRNDEFDPPHSEWSLGINDHNEATNMSPVRSVCTINYRPMPGVDAEKLIAATRQSAQRHGLELEVNFHGQPVYTPPDSPLVRMALRVTGTRKAHSVPYGTDGLAYCAKMEKLVVLGPGDIAQAHTVDEWIDLDELRRSVDVYERFIQRVCVDPAG